jgi:hypothetical protein
MESLITSCMNEININSINHSDDMICIVVVALLTDLYECIAHTYIPFQRVDNWSYVQLVTLLLV